jgi:hypothetical protein
VHSRNQLWKSDIWYSYVLVGCPLLTHHHRLLTCCGFKLQCLEDVKLKTGELILIQRIFKLSRPPSHGVLRIPSLSFHVVLAYMVHSCTHPPKNLINGRENVIFLGYINLTWLAILGGDIRRAKQSMKTCKERLNITAFQRPFSTFVDDGNEVIPK